MNFIFNNVKEPSFDIKIKTNNEQQEDNKYNKETIKTINDTLIIINEDKEIVNVSSKQSI